MVYNKITVPILAERRVFEGTSYSSVMFAAAQFILAEEKAGRTIWISGMEADHDATGHRLRLTMVRGIMNEGEAARVFAFLTEEENEQRS